MPDGLTPFSPGWPQVARPSRRLWLAGAHPKKNACTVYRCVYTVSIGHTQYACREGARTLFTFPAAKGDVPTRQVPEGTPEGKQEGRVLDIIISSSSGRPIYEQIFDQIRSAIVRGELAEGEQLPSIRALANSLRVSAITTKRAYADLEAAGLVETVQGKGSFVAGGNAELIREEQMREVEGLMAKAVERGRALGLTDEELAEMLSLVLE